MTGNGKTWVLQNLRIGGHEMIVRSRSIVAGMLLSLMLPMPPVAARGGGSADAPLESGTHQHVAGGGQGRDPAPLRTLAAGSTLLRDLFRKFPISEFAL